jgi:hypothetical protein
MSPELEKAFSTIDDLKKKLKLAKGEVELLANELSFERTRRMEVERSHGIDHMCATCFYLYGNNGTAKPKASNRPKKVETKEHT